MAAILQAGFSDGLTNLRDALNTFGAVNALKLTLIMAALTAVINGFFGTLLAYVLVRMRFPGRDLVSTVVDLPFAVPTLVFRSGVSDMHHTRATSEQLAALLPRAELVEPPWGDTEWVDRQAARNRGEGGIFSGWYQLVPQLVGWSDRAIPR